MATQSMGTMFPQELVEDLLNKVTGKSSIAKLATQKPIAFTGQKEFTFSMDNEIDIVAENGAKSHGGITVAPVTIIPIKFEYGARVSNEFMYASEERKIDILKAFNDGFAKKVARGLDLAAFHGVNPRTGKASTVVGENYLDKKIETKITYNADTADENLDAAVQAVETADGEVTGIALAPSFTSAMSKIKVNGVVQYPEFRFGGKPDSFVGMPLDVNKTVSDMDVTDNASYGYVGDFANGLKWGYAKEIPFEVIEYGCPDNDTEAGDLKGHNQVYLRSEVYLGWGFLLDSFAKICTPAE